MQAGVFLGGASGVRVIFFFVMAMGISPKLDFFKVLMEFPNVLQQNDAVLNQQFHNPSFVGSKDSVRETDFFSDWPLVPRFPSLSPSFHSVSH